MALFATAREAAESSFVEVVVPPTGAPLSKVLADLVDRYPGLVPILKASRVLVNGEYVRDRTAPVTGRDEIAIHPPYSGG